LNIIFRLLRAILFIFANGQEKKGTGKIFACSVQFHGKEAEKNSCCATCTFAPAFSISCLADDWLSSANATNQCGLLGLKLRARAVLHHYVLQYILLYSLERLFERKLRKILYIVDNSG
jgi:hypothetical protein